MKIAPRASISREFSEALREIYNSRLNVMKDEMSRRGTAAKRYYFNANKMHIHKLLTLLSDETAFNFELVRMRALPFSAYTVQTNSFGARYLCGLSFPVQLNLYDSYHSRNMRTYDMGPYWICVKMNWLLGTKDTTLGGQFHFYPDKNPMNTCRTPHHYGYTHEKTSPVFPIDYGSNTCLGGFNTIVYSLANSGDITELFRSLHTYISRHNPNSPLNSTSVDAYPWAVAL